jgi:DNA polymerase III epsilon subunit-like protein
MKISKLLSPRGSRVVRKTIDLPMLSPVSELPSRRHEATTDVYFSADIETDGPIPGPFSMLSFALVFAGTYDGRTFVAPSDPRETTFSALLRPISEQFEEEALQVNGIDRARLLTEGRDPAEAMSAAATWVSRIAGGGRPILVAYPLSFDWTFLYWYFVRFLTGQKPPFNHSGCFDLKTAFATRTRRPVARSGRDYLLKYFGISSYHPHEALEDAVEQAQLFARVFTLQADGEHQRTGND